MVRPRWLMPRRRWRHLEEVAKRPPFPTRESQRDDPCEHFPKHSPYRRDLMASDCRNSEQTLNLPICPSCGRPHRRSKTGPCSRCYQRKYRQDPEKRRKHREAVKRYSKKHPEKRKQWVRRWQERIGLRCDDLRELQRATRRLEKALAQAKHREGVGVPSQRSDDDAP